MPEDISRQFFIAWFVLLLLLCKRGKVFVMSFGVDFYDFIR